MDDTVIFFIWLSSAMAVGISVILSLFVSSINTDKQRCFIINSYCKPQLTALQFISVFFWGVFWFLSSRAAPEECAVQYERLRVVSSRVFFGWFLSAAFILFLIIFNLIIQRKNYSGKEERRVILGSLFWLNCFMAVIFLFAVIIMK